MKTQIRAKLGQQQKLSPQMMQAMKLMTMPALELQLHIQTQMDENPLLEMENEQESLTADEAEQASENSPGDFDWLSQVHATLNLQDHLRSQCELLSLTPLARVIAHTLLDSINETGYLQVTLDELFPELKQPAEQHLIRSVLYKIQQFDPPGVAARSLSECLLLQLPHCDADDELKQIMNQIIHHHMKALAQQDIQQLCRKLNKPENIVKKAIKTIKRLHPKPGLQIDSNPIDTIVPEMFIKIEGDEIIIHFNQQGSRVKLNGEMTQHEACRDYVTAAKDLIYQIHLRNQTMMTITQSIVSHQRAFFLQGPHALKPLTLEAVAMDTGLHLSTVSRIIHQKYLHTPHGVCAMKYFFNTGMGELANTVVQDLLRSLIEQENKTQPLSDNDLVNLLSEKGFTLARRTVAKYRDQLKIPSSALRKQLN